MEGLRGNAPLVRLQLTVRNDVPVAAPSQPNTPGTASSSADSNATVSRLQCELCDVHACAHLCRFGGVMLALEEHLSHLLCLTTSSFLWSWQDICNLLPTESS